VNTRIGGCKDRWMQGLVDTRIDGYKARWIQG